MFLRLLANSLLISVSEMLLIAVQGLDYRVTLGIYTIFYLA